jgi:hypothetical protein
MTRDATPYLAATRNNGAGCHTACARRFWSPNGAGTEICIMLDSGDEAVFLSSRYAWLFGPDDLAAEFSRAIREHMVANPLYRGPVQ